MSNPSYIWSAFPAQTYLVSSIACRRFAVRDTQSICILPFPAHDMTSPGFTKELAFASLQFTLHSIARCCRPILGLLKTVFQDFCPAFTADRQARDEMATNRSPHAIVQSCTYRLEVARFSTAAEHVLSTCPLEHASRDAHSIRLQGSEGWGTPDIAMLDKVGGLSPADAEARARDGIQAQRGLYCVHMLRLGWFHREL